MTEIVNKNKIDRRDSRPISEHSKFNNSYRLAGTYRFGEYAPTKIIQCIPSDNHGTSSSHKVHSYTMKQPLLQNIAIKDDTFLIPHSAILPRNYDKYINTPNVGDDVNSALVGTTVVGFTQKLYTFLDRYYNRIVAKSGGSYILTDAKRFEYYLKYLVLLDMLLSSGSMPSSVGMPLSSHSDLVDKDIDMMIGTHFSKVGTTAFALRVKIGSKNFEVGRSAVNMGDSSISFREFWNRIHDGFDWSVVSLTDSDSKIDDIDADMVDVVVNYYLVPDDEAPFDLGVYYGYQLCCAHFYTNDKVDYVYSAELWRQNFGALIQVFFAEKFGNGGFSFDNASFTYNGVKYLYDYCSAFAFNLVIDTPSNYVSFVDVADYLRLIFGYNRSLRFVDYFTGSRTRPLAPGNSDVTVSGGKVSVVETIQTKWYIRLYSQISRVGRKLAEQMKGLFPDVEPTIDWHDPIWISADQGSIFAEDVENTSAEQFDPDYPISVTSKLNGGLNGKFNNFLIQDRYCIIMTISSFDISRFYSRGVERTFFNIDRYDRFNPFCQFMGDQKVYLKELDTDADFSSVFGYRGAYMELKERLDRAFGGFANGVLPAMVFLADEGKDRFYIDGIGPDYIRSYPAELDKFFLSLSGWSYGTYFHFLMVTENVIDSNRPMAYNPQIQ